MKTSASLPPASVDAYIDSFSSEDQRLLRAMRKAVREAAPEAEEVMGYGMPTYKQEGNLVHFAAFKNHIGFYPAPSGIHAFSNELEAYRGSKGAVRFLKDKALPLELVAAVTRFRIEENKKKAAAKKKAPRKTS